MYIWHMYLQHINMDGHVQFKGKGRYIHTYIRIAGPVLHLSYALAFSSGGITCSDGVVLSLLRNGSNDCPNSITEAQLVGSP